MSDRSGIFAGENPFQIMRVWLAEAENTEPNDPNAMALATVDGEGLPNVRIVLLKDIEENAFVFYSNYESAKGEELACSGKAAFVMHWKSLGRQVRVRGDVTREDGDAADAYFASRALNSRIGAWASQQSRPLTSRDELMSQVKEMTEKQGDNPKRPPYWGGYRITPVEIEFWADGAHRLHDRFRWTRSNGPPDWSVSRLSP